MGLIVDKPELLAALGQADHDIRARQQETRRAIRTLDDLAADTTLTGQAWTAAKRQATDVVKPRLEQAISQSEQIMADNREFRMRLESLIEDDYLDEDGIADCVNRIRQADNLLRRAQDLLPDDAGELKGLLDRMWWRSEQQANRLEDKIQRLHTLDQATRHLYQNNQSKYGKVGHGINPDGKDDSPIYWAVLEGPIGYDPLDPGENNQGQIGDCWLIATLDAMMETSEGRKQLRNGVKWDEKHHCYKVRIYKSGKPQWVTVTDIASNGVTRDGLPGIASLYEAAIEKGFGKGALDGNTPGNASLALGEGNLAESQKYFQLFGFTFHDIASDATKSGGSEDGGISVASSGDYGKTDNGEDKYSHSLWATQAPGSGKGANIRIVPNHAYEVVGAKDGMIGLRNPWGKISQSPDYKADDEDGVFWISKEDFNRLFTMESQK